MSKSNVKVVRDDVAALLRTLKLATSAEVLVGIPSTHTERNGPGEPAHNAMLGYIHEHGAPAANIPARPHLVPGVEDAQPAIVERLKKGMVAALKGDGDALGKCMHAAGLLAQSAVRARINNMGDYPEDSPTLAARRAKGYKGAKILIRTGQLRNSYTYVIRKK